MPSARPVGRRPLVWVVIAVLLILVAGCTPEPPVPPPVDQPQVPATSATPTPPTRAFTVATTETFAQADPAAVTTPMSTSLVLNVFQRLMTAPAGEAVLKPDAAQECRVVETATVYTCTLQPDLYFHNGHRLTASDVKFSIERARRLDIPGTSTSLLGALKTITTPDELTVRFTLTRQDSQFGFALASPAASIVDEQLYDPDEVRPITKGVVGSGPFLVGSLDGSAVEFTRYGQYLGPYGAALSELQVRRFAGSGDVEDAMAAREVDAVWRGLSEAARSRFEAQRQSNGDGRTASGYTALTETGTRVFRLEWNPDAKVRENADLRAAVAGLLQESRTMDSIVASGVGEHVATFEEGGVGGANITWTTPIPISLSYDPSVPDAADRATTIASRLEASKAVDVTLVSDPRPGSADLALVDRMAWTATTVAWSQAYLDHPAIGSSVRVAQLLTDYGRAGTPQDAQVVATEIQKQAAADQVLVPVSQSDDQIFLLDSAAVDPTAFGPGWQLGLWGFTR